MKLTKLICICFLFGFVNLSAQDSTNKKFPIKVTGTMGITYEGYGLNVKPTGSNIYTPRRPWNQVRFLFAPTLQFGNKFSLPLNFNFASVATNFAGPYAGLKNQSIGQWLTNPMNNFSINPAYKWAELLLGTQYLKYSDLSTGDIGIFGAGFNLHPGKFMFRFFTGTSQQGINYAAAPPPGITGAFKRTHYMFQIGTEVEGSHKVAFNFSKGKDAVTSVTAPPLAIKPQEGFNTSFILDKYFKKGWFINLESALSFFTRDLTQPLIPGADNLSFKPFIAARTSTAKDFAGQMSVGKKSPNLDISYATKYIGAGYQTTGFPFMQPDHWDNTINTRFNTWKNKINVTASMGQRVNNISNTSLRASQFLGNLNWFTQFNDRFSLNINYNNFGFQTASGLNPFGIKNVSNDLGISPMYTWTTATMTHLLTVSYNYSKYDERDVITGITTSNNTHTALLTYVPVYFNKELTPDFSVLYFTNTMPAFKNTFITLSSSLGMPVAKKKIQLRGQLQYTIGKLNTFTANNNLVVSCTIDWKINKKLSWNSFFSTNYYRYGNELGSIPLIGANYLESSVRTGLQYKF
ncbi:MAG: hypothetical protein M0Q26_03225 [Chitinophagaceae bacterium]|nr:hypothetical protein [Chitinophagaceae bacterium]MDP1762912.1 hypothetical protein [Sediminibacterium sp.]MDP1812678.1 hypothetical protein [Sediminibacterium sp.]MDP3127565.1 hypothetical protein [Sediminibacterium sp.]